MSSVRYTTNNQNTYGAEQGYTVPNPIQTVTSAAEAQYAGYYQSAYPATYTNSNAANKEVVYANYVAPNTTTSEVRNTYAFGAGNTGASYALPATGTPYANNAATYATNYANNAATNVASTVRNTVVGETIAPPPKITFGHPSGGYVQNTTYYQQPQNINTNTTVVTNQQPTVQTITSNVAVQEQRPGQGSVVQQVKANAPTTAVSTQGSNYASKNNDEFLCSKWCWILSAVLGMLLLTLALLYGLGVIGGPVGSGTNANAPVASAGSGKVGAGAVNVNGPHIGTPNLNVNGPSVSAPNVNLNGPSVNANGPSVSGTTSVSPIPSIGVAPVPSVSTPTYTQPSINYQQPTVRPASVAPVAIDATPVTYNSNVRPAAVYNSFAPQPVAVNTEPVIYHPTYTQPVSVEPSSVSYQPTYTRPASVSVQPVSVEPSAVYTRPTVYNGPVRPTGSYPEPTEVYNAPHNNQFVPAVPVQ